MKYIFTFLFILFLFTHHSHAQNPVTISVYGSVKDASNDEPVAGRAVNLVVTNQMYGDTVYTAHSNEQGLYAFNSLQRYDNDLIQAIVFNTCDFEPTIETFFPVNDTNILIDFEICVPDNGSPVGADPSWFNYAGAAYTFSFFGFSSDNRNYYHWDFGDQTYEEQQNVTHTYSSTFSSVTVSLFTAFVDPYSFDTLSPFTISEVVYLNACSNWFTYENNGQGMIVFSGYSEPEADSYSWDFGDGDTMSGQNVNHVYADTSGVVVVTLTTVITNQGNSCEAISSQEINFGGSNPITCENWFTYEDIGQNNFIFTGFSDPEASTYTWDFGDGETMMGQSVSHQFDFNLEEVNVTLTTVYINPPDSCTAFSTQTITFDYVSASFLVEIDSLSLTPNTFNFSQNSIGNITNYFWDFGDGATSNLPEPSHIYQQAGEYIVCLSVQNENLSDTYCIGIQTPDYYNVGGVTYLDYIPMNSSAINGDTAIAQIFQKHGNQFLLYKTVEYYEYGYFYFNDILTSDYLVKIKLTKDSDHYSEYIPSYYGDTKNWYDANEIIVSDSNLFDLNTNLSMVAEMGIGNGSISGSISLSGQCGGEQIFTNTCIFLKNSNSAVVRYAEPNEDGEFEFQNLPNGQYSIDGDYMNMYLEPLIVTIDDENPISNDVELNFVCDNPNGINEIVSSSIEISEVYPNPVANYCKLDVILMEEDNLIISINSLTGKQIYLDNYSLSDGKSQLSIPTSSLSKGSYILSIRSTRNLFDKHLIFVK